MRKLVLAFVLALLFGTGVIWGKKIKNASLEDIVTVAPGAVTFKVEDVEIADDLLPEKNGADLGRKWAEGKPYLGSSFADKSLVDGDDNAFFSMVCLAYAQHRPIVLSPDIMWIIICNGYSQYVNRDPESFRQYLVDHEGKETLLIKTTPETSAAQKVEKFAELIAKETKGDVAELMTCNFSTTGMIERMVSQITLMETVKQYFDYLNLVSGCGIPSITLEGTPDDWRLLREKTRKLGEFGVKSWTDKLDPILAEFVSASEGNPNLKFWWNIAIKGRPYDFHLKAGGGCLPKYGPTPFNGWFLEFIPFDTKGERPSAIPYGHKLPPLMTSVPIIQYFEDDMGNCIGINSLDLRGGIVGLAQDEETKALRPEIGWLVRNDPKMDFDEDDVRAKIQEAKTMGDGDVVIKSEIKKNGRTKGVSGSFAVVTGDKPKAGDIIFGTVQDAYGPMMMVNVTERDDRDRIVAHSITDIEGNFSFRLVNPDDQLQITYVGYEKLRTSITGSNFTVTMAEQEDLPMIEITSDPGAKPQGIPIPLRESISF